MENQKNKGKHRASPATMLPGDTNIRAIPTTTGDITQSTIPTTSQDIATDETGTIAVEETAKAMSAIPDTADDNAMSNKVVESYPTGATPPELRHTHAREDSSTKSSATNVNGEAEDSALRVLVLLLEEAQEHLGRLSEAPKREAFTFSLRHLFYATETLYNIALPKLSSALARGEETEQLVIQRRFGIWSGLREIEHILQRVEILCRLFSSHTSVMLDALDSTDLQNIKNEPAAASKTQGADREATLPRTARHKQSAFTTAPLLERLAEWRQQANFPLSQYFATLQPPLPSLSQGEQAITLFLSSACTIFGAVLPDLLAISVGDDKVTATLLLDLIQQTDLLLLHSHTLLELLPILLHHYALTAETQASC